MQTTRNIKTPEVLTLLDLLSKVDQCVNLSGKIVSNIEKSLSECWTQLEGSSQERTTPQKLSRRTENMNWCPPILTFMIERHGGTVNGSTRADLHTWQINLESMTARIVRSSSRQIEPTLSPLDVKPLIERIIQAVASNTDADGIRWAQGRKQVNIKASHFIPDNCCAQTLAGRRKRFRTCLDERMKNLGWNRESGRFYVYIRT